jgi:hypothetical protein
VSEPQQQGGHSAEQFRDEHGDLATWQPVDFEVYEHLIVVDSVVRASRLTARLVGGVR